MSEQTSSNIIDLGISKLAPGCGRGDGLFCLHHPDLEAPLRIDKPVFEINGELLGDFRCLDLDGQAAVTITQIPGGGRSLFFRCGYPQREDVTLTVEIRSYATSPILRFRYRLTSARPLTLTKSGGADNLFYFRISQPGPVSAALNTGALAEYQLSHFDSVQHSYMPYRAEHALQDLLPGTRFAGPVALFHTPGQTVLAAYEHGADHPDSFFDFSIAENSAGRALELRARKGNYYNGQIIGGEAAWESVWFEVGLQPGDLEDFLPRYRRFFLEEVCENQESRRPYIYYNTWNYQERQKYFKGRPYLESMQAERMLAEIDVAHRLGIDAFVVDTGWYKKTGDWLPNLERFPEGLKEIKRRLDQYGMKLGLWFNPTVAALTSKVFTEHPEWEMSWQGKPRWRGPVWETEESTSMCLASDYVDYYIEVMVRLHQELEVSYFKWDAVSQYGCDSPDHQHGTAANTTAERADCYAYQMGRSMIRIVEEVTRRCPGVIVDFDITEGGRFVGMGFLSAGKFFLVNNGPYFHEFDIPKWVKMEPDTINVFFYPGPARPRVCRTGARYDELIPSILFLTHYLPDPPLLSQRNSMASLVLGGNGWWGDLPALSEEDILYLSGQIGLYKHVAEDLTRAFPRVRGFAGSSPEIHEKVNPETCGGAVVFFTVTPGKITHVTQPLNLDKLGEVVGADDWEVVDGQRLMITVDLERDDARVVYVISQGN